MQQMQMDRGHLHAVHPFELLERGSCPLCMRPALPNRAALVGTWQGAGPPARPRQPLRVSNHPRPLLCLQGADLFYEEVQEYVLSPQQQRAMDEMAARLMAGF